MDPRLFSPHADPQPVLSLLHEAFAYMDGLIDPPSSLHRLTGDDLRMAPEVWLIGPEPRACMVLTPKPETLYLGKLAVGLAWRGQGLARRLIDHACNRAQHMGFASVTLETRVELTDNHRTFAALGFAEIGRSAHAGYAHPTSITFRKPV